MQNDRIDNISYEDGWITTSSPETYDYRKKTVESDLSKQKISKKSDKVSAPTADNTPKPRQPFRLLLLTVQLALCLAIIGGVFVLKQVGGEAFDKFKNFYTKNINNTIFETPQENILDLSEIFDNSPENIPDESSTAQTDPATQDTTGNTAQS